MPTAWCPRPDSVFSLRFLLWHRLPHLKPGDSAFCGAWATVTNSIHLKPLDLMACYYSDYWNFLTTDCHQLPECTDIHLGGYWLWEHQPHLTSALAIFLSLWQPCGWSISPAPSPGPFGTHNLHSPSVTHIQGPPLCGYVHLQTHSASEVVNTNLLFLTSISSTSDHKLSPLPAPTPSLITSPALTFFGFTSFPSIPEPLSLKFRPPRPPAPVLPQTTSIAPWQCGLKVLLTLACSLGRKWRVITTWGVCVWED